MWVPCLLLASVSPKAKQLQKMGLSRAHVSLYSDFRIFKSFYFKMCLFLI